MDNATLKRINFFPYRTIVLIFCIAATIFSIAIHMIIAHFGMRIPFDAVCCGALVIWMVVGGINAENAPIEHGFGFLVGLPLFVMLLWFGACFKLTA